MIREQNSMIQLWSRFSLVHQCGCSNLSCFGLLNSVIRSEIWGRKTFMFELWSSKIQWSCSTCIRIQGIYEKRLSHGARIQCQIGYMALIWRRNQEEFAFSLHCYSVYSLTRSPKWFSIETHLKWDWGEPVWRLPRGKAHEAEGAGSKVNTLNLLVCIIHEVLVLKRIYLLSFDMLISSLINVNGKCWILIRWASKLDIIQIDIIGNSIQVFNPFPSHWCVVLSYTHAEFICFKGLHVQRFRLFICDRKKGLRETDGNVA